MRLFQSLLLILVSVLVQACSNQATEVPIQSMPVDLGRVSLAFSNPPPEITDIVATISRNGFPPRVLQLTISDTTSSASGHFTNVEPGVWHLRVVALDSSEVVRFSGETDVNVQAGQISQVALQLVPGTGGGIQIVVTWPNANNLLVNGSFEQGPWLGTYLPIDSGSTAINGWVVSRGQIDIVRYWHSFDGDRSIDLNGTPGRGGMKQTFSTSAGATYRVVFALAGNPEGAPTIKTMVVSAAGSTAQFTFDISGKTITNMGWQIKTWNFVAVGPSTTLEFYSLVAPTSIYGPAIDNVLVEVVH